MLPADPYTPRGIVSCVNEGTVMNIRISRTAAVSAIALAIAAGASGCTAATESAPVESEPSTSSPTSTSPEPSAPPSAPTATTADGLQAELSYLIEEEKLAHDVYVTLDGLWDARVFERIAASEVSHQDAVAGLLDAYGFEDPRIDEVGVFADPSLQELYDSLVEAGTQSWTSAVQVGITIEETDIADLAARIPDAPDDVAQVLERLLAGSQSHLEAFERQKA